MLQVWSQHIANPLQLGKFSLFFLCISSSLHFHQFFCCCLPVNGCCAESKNATAYVEDAPSIYERKKKQKRGIII